jgi:uncharacterized cupredoxin-like copper-binding protein
MFATKTLTAAALFAALAFTPALAHDMGGHSHGPASFDAGEPGDAKKPSRTFAVVSLEADGKMSFAPDRIEVKAGEQIDFAVTNKGELEHEFVIGSEIENAAHAEAMQAMPDMVHKDPNAVRVAPGKTEHLVWKFSKAGTFEFACLIPGHYEAGMKGAATVK